MKKNELKDCEIGSVHTLDGVTFVVRGNMADDVRGCSECMVQNDKMIRDGFCNACMSVDRHDGENVYFKKIEPILFQKLWIKLTHAYASLLKIIKSWK